MKRISLTTISIGCVAFCLIVTFGYATNSVLTPNQIREIWGAGECERCVPPGPWTSEHELNCGVYAGHGCVAPPSPPCGSVVENRIAGYCIGPNEELNCNDLITGPMTRTAYCKCDEEGAFCLDSLGYNGYLNYDVDCFQTPRRETCE